MSELDWRPPGSDRVQAKPFWSPMGRSSAAEPDPFRASPADRVRRPGQIPLTLDALGLGARPGIVPLRPLGLGDVMGGVIRAIRGNVGSTMGLAAITNVVFLVPMTAVAAWTGSLSTTVDSGPQLQLMAQYLPMVGTWLSSILLTGFMAYVIGQGVRGRRVTPYETFTQTMRRVGALLLATLLVVGTSLVLVAGAGFAVFLMISGGNDSSTYGMVVGLLVGFVVIAAVMVLALALQTLFAFTTPVVVLERVSAVKAIARSWHLVGSPTRGGFWRILGIRLLTSIVTSVVGQVIAWPITIIVIALLGTLVGDQFDNYYVAALAVLQGMVAILTGVLTTPFIAGVDALLYVDARMRKEALDVDLMRAGHTDEQTWSGVQR
jgi:hypothetical protein